MSNVSKTAPILIVMRLADMVHVHPRQIEATCQRCRAPVGIYPSGQDFIIEYPSVEIVCLECQPSADGAKLVPGAGIDEARQSVPGPAFKRR